MLLPGISVLVVSGLQREPCNPICLRLRETFESWLFMLIIPAIDIKNGKCVRLEQGRIDKETVFSLNPVAIAKKWEAEGAEWIHIIDLDGAFEKYPKNFHAISSITKNTKTHIQVGGGIRDSQTIHKFLDIGVDRVIIGTEAIRNPDSVIEAAKRHPDQIIVGIDAREGWVAVEGWTETTRVRAIDLAKKFDDCGLAAINFTDILRDGMQSGINIEETRQFATAISTPVIASGGVATIDDIKRIIPLEKDGVVGVITGKAIYSNTLDLREAIQLANRAGVNP